MNSEKKRLVLQVEGMTCPSCERKLEKGLAKVVGVTDVKASYQDCRISLDYDPETVTPEMLLTVVEKLGYSAVVSDASVGDTRCAAGNNLRINQILGMGII
ncbi:MAG TPA: heavy metal-associated domain-containing protein, partial [Bacillota bacterium]|nr:heavy metal-associated domain-containing protein [Bacillota bacterium]